MIIKPSIPRRTQVLRNKKTVITLAVLWLIHHDSGKDDICLKVGRYKKASDARSREKPECLSPKSELTLDNEEFQNLIAFVRDNYEPFKGGARAYIPLDQPFNAQTAKAVRGLLNHPEKRHLVNFIAEHEIVPEHLVLALHHKRRLDAIAEFERMLADDLAEPSWQKWFETNSWVLGTEFTRILDDRAIDVEHISDFLMQAYDGFLDIVEIKRPEGRLKFWAESRDHGNYIPSSDLVKAITQASRYVYEVEREANNVKFLERVDHVKTIKPRCILIFGRSQDWDAEKSESYRILNASFHNLTILTYDHVLARARRLLEQEQEAQEESVRQRDMTDDVPF